MKIISLLISLFGIIKTKALECVSVTNQECMPRPKIFDVNEGVGEALFYPYNVLVNKCSGSCNTLDTPMAKLCVPNIIKRVNMKVCNFLMRLNETRHVLWHESCKCVCQLNSSVCNSKQIWNSDTCSCDCNEDFAGIMTCSKGYMWNPSTYACECDMWCKPGQYLDYKKCVCKNKLISKFISECTSLINETMIGNKKYISNDDTITNIFIGLFSVLLFIGTVCFCVFAYFKWIKGKKLFKNKFRNKYADYLNYTMDIKSLKIKTKTNYNWDDMVYIYDFDVNLVKIIKRESRIGANIYYIRYMLEPEYYYNNSIKPLYFVINRLFGCIEEIKGSSDRYLVVNINNEKIINILDKL